MTAAATVDAIEWSAVEAGLDDVGIALTGPVLDSDACAR